MKGRQFVGFEKNTKLCINAEPYAARFIKSNRKVCAFFYFNKALCFLCSQVNSGPVVFLLKDQWYEPRQWEDFPLHYVPFVIA